MKRITIAGLILAIVAGSTAGQSQETPQLPGPEKEHEWLQQLVGEWEAEAEVFIAPGQPPVKSKSTESVRSIGGFWVVAENKGRFMDQPFTGLLTLGYDAEKGQYVGTWIDSMNSYLWTYSGKLDTSGKVLTLETQGPCPHAPGELSRFREVLDLKSKDHKVFTSSIQGEDGNWTTLMTINYRRKT